jgi:N-acyl-D-aspartate/D-glutamate deacylase
MEPETGIAIGVTMYVLGACYIGALFARSEFNARLNDDFDYIMATSCVIVAPLALPVVVVTFGFVYALYAIGRVILWKKK